MRISNNFNDKYNQKISFKAFPIKDAETPVNKFLRMTKDEAIPRLENAEEGSAFNKIAIILKNAKDSTNAVFNACCEGLNLNPHDYNTEFDLPTKIIKIVEEMGQDDKNDNFLKRFIKGIAGSVDENPEGVEFPVKKNDISINVIGNKKQSDKKPQPKIPYEPKLKPKSLSELTEEGEQRISQKKRNQNSDKIKSSIDEKRKLTSERIKTVKLEMKQHVSTVNQFWSKLNKSKVLSSSDGSLDEMRELHNQKEIALKQMEGLESELQKLLTEERRLK